MNNVPNQIVLQAYLRGLEFPEEVIQPVAALMEKLIREVVKPKVDMATITMAQLERYRKLVLPGAMAMALTEHLANQKGYTMVRWKGRDWDKMGRRMEKEPQQERVEYIEYLLDGTLIEYGQIQPIK